MVEYFRRRAVAAAVVAGVVAFVGIFVLRADARYVFDGLTCTGPALRHPVRRSAASASLVLLLRNADRGARILAIGRGRQHRRRLGRRPMALHPAESLKVAEAAAPSGTLTALLVATVGAVLIVLPGFILLYTLDQKSLLPAEGTD